MSNYEKVEYENSEDINISKIKRKIRAWCGLCYQFFENGPTAKNCQDHLKKGKCNLVECKKGFPNCVRKFPNINSENRHTYCLTLDDISSWDQSCNIQNNIYKEITFNSSVPLIDNNDLSNSQINNASNLFISDNENTAKNENLSSIDEYNKIKSEKLFSIQNEDLYEKELKPFQNIEKKFNVNINHEMSCEIGNYFNHDISYDKETYLHLNNTIIPNMRSNNEVDNIFEINPPKFSDVDDDALISEFSKIYFTPEKKKSNLNDDLDILRKEAGVKLNLDPKKIIKENYSIYQNTNKIKQTNNINYLIKDETGIEEILDQIQIETKIPKTSINKLKTAFKKKGFNTVKLIRLMKNKQQNWNFLLNEFKDVCTQIQGVALYLENLLEQVIF